MSAMPQRTTGPGNSFMPEDYLQKKAEKRAIVISLALFMVVAIGIVGAFFVTYRKWSDVKTTQERVNRDYATESAKIEQLKVLQKQREELKEKADVTMALVERVPRSILLAELINRMPKEQMTLTELTIKSTRITAPPPVAKPSSIAGPQTISEVRQGQLGASGQPATEKPKPTPPRFDFRIELAGLATTDEDVADYYESLVNCPLLTRVDMIFSQDTTVDNAQLRKFKIEASLRANVDARQIEPLRVPRLASKPIKSGAKALRDPMDPTAPRDDSEPMLKPNMKPTADALKD